MSLPWHARNHQDALDGMLMLTLEERGAYNTALDLIYSRSGPIPDDARWLSGWMGVSLRRWAVIRASLLVKGKLFEVNLNGAPSLMNQRAAIEIENAAKLRRKLAESGAKGGRKTAEAKPKTNENNVETQAPLEASLKLIDINITEQKDEEANASLSPEGDAKGKYPDVFEACWKAYPHVKGRSSKTKAFGYWRRIPADTRTQLHPAIERYAKDGREPNDECGAPAMDRWLRDTRYLDWLDGENPPAAVAPTFSGPAEIRAAIVAARGEDFTRAWLDRCQWDDENRAVLSPNGLVVDRLHREVGQILSRFGARVRKVA